MFQNRIVQVPFKDVQIDRNSRQRSDLTLISYSGYRKHKAPHLKKPAVLMAFSAVNGERFV